MFLARYTETEEQTEEQHRVPWLTLHVFFRGDSSCSAGPASQQGPPSRFWETCSAAGGSGCSKLTLRHVSITSVELSAFKLVEPVPVLKQTR